jgi:hypothetical protein
MDVLFIVVPILLSLAFGLGASSRGKNGPFGGPPCGNPSPEEYDKMRQRNNLSV